MQITDVRVRKVAKEGKLKAVVSITMDEEFVVHDIKVIEGEKGLFIAMPSKKALDGEYRDIAHPINSGTRERIQNIIFCFYVTIGCLGAWRFAGFHFPRMEKALFSFAIIASTCIALSPIEYAAQVIQGFFSITVLIFIAKCISYPYFAYKSRLPETYFLAVTYLVFIPIAIHDAIFMSTLQGKPLSPYTAPFSSAVIGFVLAFRLARNAREIERFNQTFASR